MRHRGHRPQWQAVFALTLGVGTVGVLAARAATSAPQRQVPEEMVLALVKNMYQPVGSPEPSVLVGEMPEGLADRLWLPEDAQVYGTIVEEGIVTQAGDVSFSEPGSITVVVGVGMQAEAVKARLREQMAALGWRSIEAFERIGPQTQQGALIPVVFCSETNEAVWVLADARGSDAGRSLLRINVSPDREGSPCRPQPERQLPRSPPRDVPPGPERARMAERLRLSDLTPPPSSFMAAGRCPAGSAGMSTTNVSTELSPAELVEHYAAQLEQVGWERSDPGSPPPAASAGWRRVLDGESYEAVLQVVQHPGRPDCFSIQLATTFDGQR